MSIHGSADRSSPLMRPNSWLNRKRHANALALATFLEAQPKVARVYYPGLESHSQSRRAKALFRGGGGLLAFELVPGENCFDVIDSLATVVCSSHLGDTRTLISHPATMTHADVPPEECAALGVSDARSAVKPTAAAS